MRIYHVQQVKVESEVRIGISVRKGVGCRLTVDTWTCLEIIFISN